MGWLAITGALFVLVGCGKKIDPRFQSAEATLGTLFRAYGVDRTREPEVREHMQSGGKFKLRSEDEFRACFADYRGPLDEGLAGFVFGRLVARKDSLTFETKGDRTQVFIRDQSKGKPAAVMVAEASGWKLSLKESVPADVAGKLRELYRRAEEDHRRETGSLAR